MLICLSFDFSVVLFICHYQLALEGLYYAAKAGIAKENYAFIVIEDSPASLRTKLSRPFQWFFSKLLHRAGKDTKREVKKIFSSVLVLGSLKSGERNAEYNHFSREVRRRMNDTLFNSTAYPSPENSSAVSYTLLKQVSLPSSLFNTYSVKQPDLYYFEAIKMTSQAWSNFVWRIRAADEYSL